MQTPTIQPTNYYSETLSSFTSVVHGWSDTALPKTLDGNRVRLSATQPPQLNWMKPNLEVSLDGTTRLATDPKIPPQTFNGSQLLDLYNVPRRPRLVAKQGVRQARVVIVVAFTYSKVLDDLRTYWQNSSNFGPNSTPPTVSIYTMPDAGYNAEWAAEECLDVQMVCTINPNASIWVVEAKSDRIVDLIAAVDYATNTLHADVVSMSWGARDTENLGAFASHFTNTSVCYCAASGDYNYVSWPSVLSNCLSVGGTTLLWTPNESTRRTEYTCSISGCGYSKTVAQPVYQQKVDGIERTYRAIPDISLVADPNTGVYTVFQGRWSPVGGTSVGTALCSGMLSLAIQARLNAGKSGLTTVVATNPADTSPPSNNVQAYLYRSIYPSASRYAADFYDITVGTNKGSIGGDSTRLTTYQEGAGYQLPTGLGSPNCASLCDDLLNV